MKKFLRLIFIVALALPSTIALAKTFDWALSDAIVNYGLNEFGASYQMKGHTLTIIINQQEALDHLDDQIQNSVYQPSITKDYLINHPIVYLTTSALNARIFIIPRAYQDHSKINYINVNIITKYENIMGNDTTNPLISFNMSIPITLQDANNGECRI